MEKIMFNVLKILMQMIVLVKTSTIKRNYNNNSILKLKMMNMKMKKKIRIMLMELKCMKNNQLRKINLKLIIKIILFKEKKIRNLI